MDGYAIVDWCIVGLTGAVALVSLLGA